MISFVCWKWATPGYRTAFTAEHVNTWAAMVQRNYAAPHRLLCVTNDPDGIDPRVTIIPDAEDFKDVASPHGGGNPSCFRRLRLFRPDAAATFGQRIVSMDLDCVITGDLRPLVDRDETFVGWRDPLRRDQYCGSLTLLTAGARPQVWQQFDPQTSPREARAAGFMGSDQGHVSHILGPGEAQWTPADGVYSYRWDQVRGHELPAGARIVFFTGEPKCWGEECRGIDWVREHYFASTIHRVTGLNDRYPAAIL